MKKWTITAGAALLVVGACDQSRTTSPAFQGAAPAGGAQVFIVNYDETRTTEDAVTNAILATGAGVLQFNNFSMVATLATPDQLVTISALPGLEGIYANRQLQYYMLHESVPSIRADAVHAAGVTGKGVGIAILDSGIDGLYNPDVAYPQHTIQNIKVIFNQNDVFTFGKDVPRQIRKAGVALFVENLPNSETSVGHGTHVAGIAAGLGTASNGYYRGVAPGANLIGIGTGDILFVLFALAGFDYILDHREQYNIQVVNNSWGTTGAFDPHDPVNEATKKVASRGITVVFAAGNEGPGPNTLNPYSVAPWVISVAAGCKLGVVDPTNSESHCMLDDGSNPLVPTDNEPRAHVLADFSSRGIAGDALYHPDIMAPGVHIVSGRASTGTVINALDANHDARICNIAALNQPFYTCASGTSMAAPHIAGVVALMQEAAGGKLKPEQVLQALVSTARPLPGYGAWEVGAGYVDAFAAVMAVKK